MAADLVVAAEAERDILEAYVGMRVADQGSARIS